MVKVYKKSTWGLVNYTDAHKKYLQGYKQLTENT